MNTVANNNTGWAVPALKIVWKALKWVFGIAFVIAAIARAFDDD